MYSLIYFVNWAMRKHALSFDATACSSYYYYFVKWLGMRDVVGTAHSIELRVNCILYVKMSPHFSSQNHAAENKCKSYVKQNDSSIYKYS